MTDRSQILHTTVSTNHLDDLPALSHPMVDEARQHLLRMASYLPASDKAVLMHACHFGDIAHIKDKRKSGEPYITHPIAVAQILAGFRVDIDTLVAAILHDTVEDTEVCFDDVATQFGDTVAMLVDGVTKLKSSKMTKQESQAATFHKIITATIADPRVLIIKLSDRLHNMSTLGAVPPEKQKRTAQETLSFYVPFARVLGLNDIADYIELLCYRNLDEQMYTKFNDKLLQHGLGRQYQKVAIQSYLQNTLTTLGINGVVQVLDNRTAMARQFFKNRGDLNRLIHHYEFEVVTNTVEDCDKLAFYLVNTHAIDDSGIFDNIRKPLPGGNQSLTLLYQSDHNLIKVTLLTKQMQRAARLGVMGNDSELSQSVIQASLRNMQDLVSDEGDTVAVINELLGYLHERKIVCYSPKGQAYELPRGATALDFAYAVGPIIGNVATGAFINGKAGTLGQMLAAGDVVQIDTDSNAIPKAEWLGIVATNKARTCILKSLKSLSDHEKICQGRNALARALKNHQKTTADLSDDDWVDLLAWRGVTDQDQLFLQIANGNLLPQLVVSKLFSEMVDNSEQSAITQSQHLIAGVQGVELGFAKCCNPIYGDAIVGHLSRHGLIVHRHKCYSITNIRKDNPYQVIHLGWKVSDSDNHQDKSLRFSAFLRIFLQLNEEQISQVIYQMRKLNIGIEKTDINHDRHEKTDHKKAGTTTLQLVVRSRSHLNQGISIIRKVLDYPNVMRLYHL